MFPFKFDDRTMTRKNAEACLVLEGYEKHGSIDSEDMWEDPAGHVMDFFTAYETAFGGKYDDDIRVEEDADASEVSIG